MNFWSGQGANHGDTGSYREDLQTAMAEKTQFSVPDSVATQTDTSGGYRHYSVVQSCQLAAAQGRATVQRPIRVVLE